MYPVYLVPLGPIVILLFYLNNHFREYDRLQKISFQMDEVIKKAGSQQRISFGRRAKPLFFDKADMYWRIEKKLEQVLRQDSYGVRFTKTSRLKFEYDAYRAYSDLDIRIDLLLDQFEIPQKRSWKVAKTKLFYKNIALLDVMNEKLNTILRHPKIKIKV